MLRLSKETPSVPLVKLIEERAVGEVLRLNGGPTAELGDRHLDQRRELPGVAAEDPRVDGPKESPRSDLLRALREQKLQIGVRLGHRALPGGDLVDEADRILGQDADRRNDDLEGTGLAHDQLGLVL